MAYAMAFKVAISTQLSTYGRFWSDVLNSKLGNIFWKNAVHSLKEYSTCTENQSQAVMFPFVCHPSMFYIKVLDHTNHKPWRMYCWLVMKRPVSMNSMPSYYWTTVVQVMTVAWKTDFQTGVFDGVPCGAYHDVLTHKSPGSAAILKDALSVPKKYYKIQYIIWYMWHHIPTNQ